MKEKRFALNVNFAFKFNVFKTAALVNENKLSQSEILTYNTFFKV